MKKSLSLILAVCVVLSLAVTSVSAKTFKDAEITPWAARQIDKWTDLGVMHGVTDTVFGVNIFITRGEMADVLSKLFSKPKADISILSMYSDVDESTPYAQSIANCTADGIFKGYTDGTFKPNDSIIREEIITILGRTLSLISYANEKQRYLDAAKVSDWSEPYVNGLTKDGRLEGYPDGEVKPQRFISKAETAKLISNLVDHYITKGGDYEIQEGDIVVIVTPDPVNLKGGSPKKVINTNGAETTAVGNTSIGNKSGKPVTVNGTTIPEGDVAYVQEPDENGNYEKEDSDEIVVIDTDKPVNITGAEPGDTFTVIDATQQGSEGKPVTVGQTGTVIVITGGGTYQAKDGDTVIIATSEPVTISGGKTDTYVIANGAKLNLPNGTKVVNHTPTPVPVNGGSTNVSGETTTVINTTTGGGGGGGSSTTYYTVKFTISGPGNDLTDPTVRTYTKEYRTSGTKLTNLILEIVTEKIDELETAYDGTGFNKIIITKAQEAYSHGIGSTEWNAFVALFTGDVSDSNSNKVKDVFENDKTLGELGMGTYYMYFNHDAGSHDSYGSSYNTTIGGDYTFTIEVF